MKEVLVEDLHGYDLAKILINLAREYDVLAQKKKCSVVVHRQSLIERIPILAVNRELLKQAVSNLLDNAVKYSVENTVIEVTAHKSPDDNFGFIFVTNRGIGIPQAERELIFKAGHRGANAMQKMVPVRGWSLVSPSNDA